jgi:hypothetical protein
MDNDPVYYSTGCRVHPSGTLDNQALSGFIEKIKNRIKNKLNPSYNSIM